MTEEYKVQRVLVQFKSSDQATRFYAGLRGREFFQADWVTTPDEINVVSIGISTDRDTATKQARYIVDALRDRTGWEFVGPRCKHKHENPTTRMMGLTHDRTTRQTCWMCLDLGCRKKHGIVRTPKLPFVLSFEELRDLLKIAIDTETTGISPAAERRLVDTAGYYGMKPERLAQLTNMSIDKATEMLDKWKEKNPTIPPPPTVTEGYVTHNPAYDPKLMERAARPFMHSQKVQGCASDIMDKKVQDSDLVVNVASGRYADTAKGDADQVAAIAFASLNAKFEQAEKQLRATEKRNQELLKELKDWEYAKLLPKDLFKAFDRAFRFMAGLNLQDHSIAEQKEFVAMMSKLKKEMNNFKEQFEGDEYNEWLKD